MHLFVCVCEVEEGCGAGSKGDRPPSTLVQGWAGGEDERASMHMTWRARDEEWTLNPKAATQRKGMNGVRTCKAKNKKAMQKRTFACSVVCLFLCANQP